MKTLTLPLLLAALLATTAGCSAQATDDQDQGTAALNDNDLVRIEPLHSEYLRNAYAAVAVHDVKDSEARTIRLLEERFNVVEKTNAARAWLSVDELEFQVGFRFERIVGVRPGADRSFALDYTTFDADGAEKPLTATFSYFAKGAAPVVTQDVSGERTELSRGEIWDQALPSIADVKTAERGDIRVSLLTTHRDGAFSDSVFLGVQTTPRDRSAATIATWNGMVPVSAYPLRWFSRVDQVRFIDATTLRVDGTAIPSNQPISYEVSLIRQTNEPVGFASAQQVP